MIGRGGIELLPGRPALLRKNAGHVEIVGLVADRHGDDPLAARGCARELGDAALDVGDGAHASERGVDAFETLAIHVGMAIDEAGHDGAAGEVDHARRRGDMLGDRGVRADRENLVARDRYRRSDGEIAIDGDDLAVLEDEVGGTCGREPHFRLCL
jgi:hypothetical protein